MKKFLIASAAIVGITTHVYAAPSGMDWRNGQRLTDTMLQQFDNLKANQQDLSNLSSQIDMKSDTVNGSLINPKIQGGIAKGIDLSTAFSISGVSSTARTLSDRFFDTINVKDFGARCDGSTFDDAPAFSAAISYGLKNGRRVSFGGQCHFATSVSVSGHGWVGLNLDGNNSTITVDSGINGISIEADAATPSSDRYPFVVHNFTLRTIANSAVSTVGLNIKADNGWTFDNSSEDNIAIKGFSKQISLINLDENHFTNSALFGSSSSSIGYYLSGESSKASQWAANDIIDHVEITNGTCVNYNGALQGTKIYELGCMNAIKGVIVTNPDSAQSFEVHQSYFDVTQIGVNFDGLGLSIIDNNSADVAVNSPDPYFGYTAFSAKNCGACKVTNNFVFALGSSTNTPIVAGGGHVSITGNYVNGLAGKMKYCIEAQVPTAPGVPDHIILANNSCWAAGTFNITGDEGRVYGTGNVSSGSGSATDDSTGVLAPTEYDYGTVNLRQNDLPKSGTFFGVGKMPQGNYAFLNANLDASYQNALIDLKLAGISKFNVLPSGKVTAADSVTAAGFVTSGNILVLDSAAKGSYMSYSDGAISNAGAVSVVGVNGRPGNFLAYGYLAAVSGVCLDASCTDVVYEDSSSHKVIISNNTLGKLFSIDSSGNVVAKGTITQNGTP